VTDKALLFNGKFLSAASTGVHRVARELILGVADILKNQPDYFDRRQLLLAAPRNIREPIAPAPIEVVQTGRLTGQLWEQISLPIFGRRGLLVNLCNLAPIARPGVIMIHDAQVHISPRSYSWAFRNFYRTMQPIMARRARLVLTVSNYSREMLVKYGVAKAEKIVVIHNGVDHILRVPADQEVLPRLGLRPGGYAVALSNVQQHKNVGILLRAFAAPALAGAKLVLAGAATAEDFIKAGHECPPNVVFAGKVSDAQLRALMEGAACLAFPSTTEGFGLPPMEAMILGCPAIVAPCGALPEVCGDAALYVPPDDAPGWAAAMAGLIESPAARAELGEKGRAHAAAFTWARSAAQLAEILAGL